jgi:hypothetical protein
MITTSYSRRNGERASAAVRTHRSVERDAPEADLVAVGVVVDRSAGADRVYVQAKRYGASRAVGRPEIQERASSASQPNTRTMNR